MSKTSLSEITLEAARRGAVSGQWKLSSEARSGVLLRRRGALHKLQRDLQHEDPGAVVERLRVALGDEPHALGSFFGSSVALYFGKADLLVVLSDDDVSLLTPDAALLERVSDVLPPVWQQDSIHVLISGMDGPELTYAGRLGASFQPANYEAEVTDTLKAVFAWAEAPKPYGRIVILRGPPGTGKSYAGRAMITETNGVEWVYVPPTSVVSLTRPDMIDILIRGRQSTGPLGLLVEDADTLLRSRAGDNDNMVAQLLNLGDGIPGEIADLRIVLTTNVERLEIDKAILRQGRLFKMIEFGKLSPARASIVYQRESGGKEREFHEEMNLADVYGLAHEHTTGVKERRATMGVYV